MPAIRMRGVSKRFGERWVVRDLDLDVADGETVALIGPSGCGKTTTLRMVNRLLEPDAGSIEVLGEDVRVADPAELRRGIGYVIQEVGLFAHYTVAENVAIVPELLGWRRERSTARVRELLKLVGLPADEYAARYPRQLSGGQRQRVGIARALAADPSLVLLDEPFGALDAITRETLQDEFLSLSRRLGKSLLLVTHDVFEAVRLAHRIVVMKEGRVVQNAPPSELVRKPADEFVESMLGRHRHQLRLMTLSLAEALRSVSDSSSAASEKAIELSPQHSVWDALDELERARAEAVRVKGGNQPRFLSRQALLDAAR